LWLQQLQAGDRVAAQRLWEGYCSQLVRLARARLGAAPRTAADEEDVALSAFASFCRAVEAGRFARLADRHDLWQVLVLLAERKASDVARHARAQKRDWRREQPLAAGGGTDSSLAGPTESALVAQEPSPDFAAQVAEECRELLGQLADDT